MDRPAAAVGILRGQRTRYFDIAARTEPDASGLCRISDNRDDAAIVTGQRKHVAARRAQFRRCRCNDTAVGHIAVAVINRDPLIARWRSHHDMVGGNQPGGAVGVDRAAVDHHLADQDDVAARRDRSLVLDATSRSAAIGRIATGQEGSGIHHAGGRDKRSAGQNPAAGIDDDPRLIDQIDRPRCAQRSGNRRHIGAGDPVQRRAAAIVEGDRAASPNRETAPINNRVLGGLVNGDLGGAGANRRLPGDNLTAARQHNPVGAGRICCRQDETQRCYRRATPQNCQTHMISPYYPPRRSQHDAGQPTIKQRLFRPKPKISHFPTA